MPSKQKNKLSKNWKKIFSSRDGFSLMELAVVMAVIGILSSILIVSLKSTKSNAVLRSSQREIASAVEMARSFSLQGRTQNSVTPCGYGFRFLTGSSSDYEIFYNPLGTGIADCDTQNSDSANRRYGSLSKTAESGKLGNGALLTDASRDEAFSIFFSVPYANTELVHTVSGTPVTASSIDVCFNFSEITDYCVRINKGGNATETMD